MLEKLVGAKGQSEAINRRRIYNRMVKIKRATDQTMIYERPHRELNIEQDEHGSR